MAGIVCAIRGGPKSRKTIERAIALARETDMPLYFLYVVNLDFLTHSASSRVHTLSEEMREMGEFILLTAQAKAQAAGVEAQGVVRQGKVSNEIIALCKEVGASYVVIGRPRPEHESNVFAEEALNKFIARVRRETGAEVITVSGEDG